MYFPRQLISSAVCGVYLFNSQVAKLSALLFAFSRSNHPAEIYLRNSFLVKAFWTSQLRFICYPLCGAVLFLPVTSWVLWKQMLLRWSLGCKLFIRDQNLWKERGKKQDCEKGEVSMLTWQRSGANIECQGCAMLDQNDQTFIPLLGSAPMQAVLGRAYL